MPAKPRNLRSLLTWTVIAALGLGTASVVAAPPSFLSQGAQKEEPEDPKYRIAPTLDKASPTGVAIPKDLDAAFAELDHMLSPALRDEMRKGKEDAMGQYHFGLGMWMRNNWGLWKGLELAKWFNEKGIHHPDDMSGTILDSYWRHLNGKPIDLAGQVARYQAYWKEAAEAAKVEKARVAAASRKIKTMMMGLTLDPRAPKVVAFPKADEFGFRTRYAAPFRNGVLLTAKRFSAETIKREPDYDVRAFFLDLQTRKLSPIVAREGDVVEDAVVIEGHAYLNLVRGTKGRVLELSQGKRTFIPWPSFGTTPLRPVRLGVEETATGKPLGLLAVGNGRLARWKGGRWQTIPCGTATFPDCVLPPRKIADRLVFRDEGRHEDDKRLAWIDLAHPKGLVSFDQNVGVVGSEGPRWENVWDYATDGTDGWWVSTGHVSGATSLLRWTPGMGYRVALYHESIAGMSDPFGRDRAKSGPAARRFPITGLEAGRDGRLTAIGPDGLYALEGKRLRTLLRFENSPKGWTPSTLRRLNATTTLAGGHWGGLFLLERRPSGATVAQNVGDRLSPALRL